MESIQQIDSKFNGNTLTDSLEQEFRLKTIGLVTADEFRCVGVEKVMAYKFSVNINSIFNYTIKESPRGSGREV